MEMESLPTNKTDDWETVNHHDVQDDNSNHLTETDLDQEKTMKQDNDEVTENGTDTERPPASCQEENNLSSLQPPLASDIGGARDGRARVRSIEVDLVNL